MMAGGKKSELLIIGDNNVARKLALLRTDITIKKIMFHGSFERLDKEIFDRFSDIEEIEIKDALIKNEIRFEGELKKLIKVRIEDSEVKEKIILMGRELTNLKLLELVDVRADVIEIRESLKNIRKIMIYADHRMKLGQRFFENVKSLKILELCVPDVLEHTMMYKSLKNLEELIIGNNGTYELKSGYLEGLENLKKFELKMVLRKGDSRQKIVKKFMHHQILEKLKNDHIKKLKPQTHTKMDETNNSSHEIYGQMYNEIPVQIENDVFEGNDNLEKITLRVVQSMPLSVLKLRTLRFMEVGIAEIPELSKVKVRDIQELKKQISQYQYYKENGATYGRYTELHALYNKGPIINGMSKDIEKILMDMDIYELVLLDCKRMQLQIRDNMYINMNVGLFTKYKITGFLSTNLPSKQSLLDLMEASEINLVFKGYKPIAKWDKTSHGELVINKKGEIKHWELTSGGTMKLWKEKIEGKIINGVIERTHEEYEKKPKRYGDRGIPDDMTSHMIKEYKKTRIRYELEGEEVIDEISRKDNEVIAAIMRIMNREKISVDLIMNGKDIMVIKIKLGNGIDMITEL